MSVNPNAPPSFSLAAFLIGGSIFSTATYAAISAVPGSQAQMMSKGLNPAYVVGGMGLVGGFALGKTYTGISPAEAEAYWATQAFAEEAKAKEEKAKSKKD